MYDKKRGLLVIVVLLLFLLTFPLLAQNQLTSSSPIMYEAIHVITDCDSTQDCQNLPAEAIDLYCEDSDISCSMYREGLEGNVGDCDPVTFPSDKGCIFYISDYEPITSTECDPVFLGAGFNVDSANSNLPQRAQELVGALNRRLNQQKYHANFVSIPVIGTATISMFVSELVHFGSDVINSNPVEIFNYLKMYYHPTEKGILCSNNKAWLECNPNLKDKLYWINAVFGDTSINEPLLAYKCTERTSTSYEWVLQADMDKDQDGYPESRDCVDTGPGLNDRGQLDQTCPTFSSVESSSDTYQFKTNEEIRQEMRQKCGSDPRYASCSACINPGAPEICGDNINNDCNAVINPTSGTVSSIERSNILQGRTPDSCAANRDACEQKTVLLSTAGDGTKTEVQFNNPFNKQFSWVQQEGGQGYCCGYQGATDAGKIFHNGKIDPAGDGQGILGNYLCMAKNPDLTGFESASEAGSTPSPHGWPEPSTNRCLDDWCLLDANGAAKFKVMTIKRPELKNDGTAEFQTFDVVSNGQDWSECNQQAVTGGLPTPLDLPFQRAADEDLQSLQERSNRLACFAEGNHYSWVECAASDAPNLANTGIKSRRTGEGLYTLPLDEGGQIVEETAPTNIVAIDSTSFTSYYGDNFLFDFSGYTTLNFRIKYADPIITAPSTITLTISGPGGDSNTYFTKNILGDIINSPFFKNSQGQFQFMQVAVPLPSPSLQAVKQIKIESDKDKFILRNVYLSGDNNQLLCSGQSAHNQWSWLQNLDQGDTSQIITAEKLCTALYGPESWLGNKDQVEIQSASCCGNSKNEYYIGTSQPLGEIDKPDHYACWNSQPLKSGNTITDVEFKVGYQEEIFTPSYHEVDFSYTVYNSGTVQRDSLFVNQPRKLIKTLPTSPSSILSLIPPSVNGNLVNNMACSSDDDCTIQGSTVIFGYCFNAVCKPLNSPLLQSLSITNNDPEKVSIYFVDLTTFESLGTTVQLNSLPATTTKIGVMAELTPGSSLFPATSSINTVSPRQFSYACQPDSFGECQFPLPGNPPYVITNDHPGLYDLYFVIGSRPDEETLITKNNQRFATAGNLKVRRVSQPVLYAREPQPGGRIDNAFYGCSAANYLIGANKIKQADNLNHCAIKAGAYCAYSKTNENGLATVNSWSLTPLLDYEGVDPVAGESQGLQLITQTIPPTKLNTSSVIVPGKNLIANAEFSEFFGNTVPGWEFFDKKPAGLLKPIVNQQGFFRSNYDETTGKVKISSSTFLRSERIPVEKNMELQFSLESERCSAKVILVDQNGGLQELSLNNDVQFNTGNSAYVQLELSDCEFSKLMLQYMDSLGPAAYFFNGHATLPRSAAACCPENYCWNGYHCVAPMTDYTSLSEQTDQGRNYRCIGGQWTYQQVKSDWRNKFQGFCNSNEQCLVRLSTEGGQAQYGANDFYQGQVPTCINNGEYIFDNYCNNGNWSSRTRFLAEELLTRVGETRDHSLYCTNFAIVFPLLDDNQQSLLRGVELSASSTLLGQQQQQVCFPGVTTGPAADLVTNEENTCINNACILLFNEKTAVVTSLNKNLMEDNSFAAALGYPVPTCSGTDRFKDCQGGLYYNEDLGMAWFSKDGLAPEPTVIETISKFFQSLFTRQGELTTASFFSKVKLFREIYSAKQEGHRILALQEQLNLTDKTLVAEYENFATPICEYLKTGRLSDPELHLEPLQEAAGLRFVSCTTHNNIQRVEAKRAQTGLWPELTGKLRMNLE